MRRTTEQDVVYEQALTTEALQSTRLEFFDLDPENKSPRHLILEPSHVPGYYLILLDGELIRGEWEITDHQIEGDVVYLRLQNRHPSRKSLRNAEVEIFAAEGARLWINLRIENSSWRPEWRREW